LNPHETSPRRPDAPADAMPDIEPALFGMARPYGHR